MENASEYMRIITRAELEAAARKLDETGLPHTSLPSPSSMSLVVVKNGPGYFCLHWYKKPYDGCGDKVIAYTWHGEWMNAAVSHPPIKIKL